MDQRPEISTHLLADALATIPAERVELRFDRSFDLTQALLAAIGEDELTERLMAAMPADAPWEATADLFGILAWLTKDNGSAISRRMEDWLRAGDNPRLVRIALHQEVYPFRDRSEMEFVLKRTAEHYPDLAGRCSELIASRRLLPK